ncbi:GIY-YIG nuclease family protein [Candidatus Gracilibacteria bacterium]|nr:GIY-YIG nuclease family protein [Candidatus Gracilibacteria bacterium]NUJ98517.1 GIY-YIG nuclease family protein [Candidatus Gracilibacteria bacterium]
MSYGKTITTYLVDGSPTGIKTVELSNWIGKAIIIPRAKLKDVKNRQEVLQPAIYFLFGKNEEGNDLAYIGEAENLINRIGNHDTNKDFWDLVIAFVSKDNNLTKADVKYLEAKAIEKAKKSNRYILQNGVEPIPNNLPEYQISTMNEFLDNIDLLISAIGYPILKEINIAKKQENNENLYYLKSRGSDGVGFYNEEGFIVLKGSKISPKEIIPYQKELGYIENNRERLVENGIILNGIFTNDYLFKTPTSACNIIAGGNQNGWIEWKNKEGKTLDEMERKNLKIS